MKDGSSLVVTPSSILSTATRGLDVDLSSDKGSKEVLDDSKDESIVKMRVSDSDKDDDGGEHEIKAMGICLLSLANLLFLFFLSFLGTIL